MRSNVRSPFLVVLAAALTAILVPGDAQAQRGGGGPFGRGGGGGMELLFRDEVKEEIELVDDQETQLRDLFGTMRDQMRSVFGEVRDLPDDERREAMMARMQEVQADMKTKMNEILLPHQVERLEQLSLQNQMQRGSAADTLGSDAVKDKLGLTEDQLEKMREAAQAAEAELREKIQQATLEAREKVLTVLTPQQRATWDELMGENFAFQNRRGGRGGPGQQGGGGRGRGGRRGGGRGGAAEGN